MEQSPGYTLLYLAGSGRCGSTLLDLILNGHPEILGAGELITLNAPERPLERRDALIEPHRDEYVRFWERVHASYAERSGTSLDELDVSQPRWPRLLAGNRPWRAAWRATNKHLTDSLHEVSGAPIVTDASKMVQRLFALRGTSGIELKVIHLIRDGRAVTHSYVRRYGVLVAGMRTWMSAGISAGLLRRAFGSERWLTVRYEDLASDPAATVERVCAFLGLEFDVGMLEFASHPYFGVGGSPVTRSLVRKEIALDERWRTEMKPSHRVAFALTSAWLNRLYGYRRRP